MIWKWMKRLTDVTDENEIISFVYLCTVDSLIFVGTNFRGFMNNDNFVGT